MLNIKVLAAQVFFPILLFGAFVLAWPQCPVCTNCDPSVLVAPSLSAYKLCDFENETSCQVGKTMYSNESILVTITCSSSCVAMNATNSSDGTTLSSQDCYAALTTNLTDIIVNLTHNLNSTNSCPVGYYNTTSQIESLVSNSSCNGSSYCQISVSGDIESHDIYSLSGQCSNSCSPSGQMSNGTTIQAVLCINMNHHVTSTPSTVLGTTTKATASFTHPPDLRCLFLLVAVLIYL